MSTPLTVTYTHRCFYCTKEEVETYPLFWEQAIPKPGVPGGWLKISGCVICPEHTVKINGKVVHGPEEKI